MANDNGTNPRPANNESIVSGLSDVVGAVLGVGAAVAKTIAEATALGKPVSPGTPGEGPFADIIHYGVTAASNVAKLVVRGIPSTTQRASERSAAPSAHPAVHAGSTLRIPLSIENPSDAEMTGMIFQCADLTYEGNSAGTPLSFGAVEFQPVALTISPRDFEKLTVFIATAAGTATGLYRAKITVAGGDFESPLVFEVFPPGPA